MMTHPTEAGNARIMRNELSPAKSRKPILGFPSLDEMDMESIMDKSNAAPDELKYGTTGDGFKPLAEVMIGEILIRELKLNTLLIIFGI